MKSVLFACIHNAGRSQMAAALFNELASPMKARATSAGTQPATEIHPEVIATLRELGIELTAERPKRLTPELAGAVDLLVTMGCGESCPFIPGVERDDWPIADPKGQPLGRVREIRDEISKRVSALVQSKRWG
jgi:arsenate reductase (thioredoxin)